MGNITVAGSPYHGTGHGFFNGGKIWLRSTINAQTTTYYQKADVILSFGMKQTIGCIEEVKPQGIISLGIGYEWQYLDIDITAHNITDNDYKIGSFSLMVCQGKVVRFSENLRLSSKDSCQSTIVNFQFLSSSATIAGVSLASSRE